MASLDASSAGLRFGSAGFWLWLSLGLAFGWLGFRLLGLDFGLVSVGFGFWLSCTRILVGFESIWVDFGWIWFGLGLDFALSLAFTRIFVHSRLS